MRVWYLMWYLTDVAAVSGYEMFCSVPALRWVAARGNHPCPSTVNLRWLLPQMKN